MLTTSLGDQREGSIRENQTRFSSLLQDEFSRVRSEIRGASSGGVSGVGGLGKKRRTANKEKQDMIRMFGLDRPTTILKEFDEGDQVEELPLYAHIVSQMVDSLQRKESYPLSRQIAQMVQRAHRDRGESFSWNLLLAQYGLNEARFGQFKEQPMETSQLLLNTLHFLHRDFEEGMRRVISSAFSVAGGCGLRFLLRPAGRCLAAVACNR